MISIQGRIFVAIKIDGSDIPNSPNFVERLTMTEGMGALSPAIELVLNDYSGVLNRELALTDANSIVVTVGKNAEDQNTKTRQYRLFGTKQKTAANGPGVRAFGIYDAPGFLTIAARESFSGNSKTVVQELAKRSHLTFKTTPGAPPQDSQVWLNVCQSRAQFLQDVVRHGRVSDRSCMAACLTSGGEIRYYNLNDVIETQKDKIKRIFVHNTVIDPKHGEVVYKVRESRDYSTAGMMNAWQNYGATRVAHSLAGLQEVFDKIDIATSAGFLPINQQVAKTVKKTRIDYSTLDCGNHHANYWKAYYQNLRLLALFSEHVSILTTEITDVELFDVVIYKQANADPKEPVNKSDIYLVIGKTILVKGGANYAERIELVRRSLTVKGEAKLAGEDIGNNSASLSPIPSSLIDPTATPLKLTKLSLTSISGPLGNAEMAMTQVKANIPNFSSATKMALPAFSKLDKEIATKRATGQLLDRIGHVSSVMDHFHNMTMTLNTAISSALNPLSLLNGQVLSSRLSDAIRQTTLTRPSGILSSMAMALHSVKQQYSVASIMRDLHSSLKPMQNELRAMTDGHAILDRFQQNVHYAEQQARDSARATAQMWNHNVSIMVGKAIPKVVIPQPKSPLSLFKSGLSKRQSDGRPSTLNQQTEALTQSVSAKSVNGKPNWIVVEPEPFLPPTPIDLALDRLGDDLFRSQRLEQDMYQTDWTES